MPRTMTTVLPVCGGTTYDRIDEALRGFAQYDEFRAGRVRRSDYCAWVRAHLGFLAELGLDEERANLSTRFPRDERRQVAGILADLAAAGAVAGDAYPEREYAELRGRVEARWNHG